MLTLRFSQNKLSPFESRAPARPKPLSARGLDSQFWCNAPSPSEETVGLSPERSEARRQSRRTKGEVNRPLGNPVAVRIIPLVLSFFSLTFAGRTLPSTSDPGEKSGGAWHGCC